MSSYKDVSSYGLAVRVRSHKTVLVEGATDKIVISKLILSKTYSQGQKLRFFIDDASMIKEDPMLARLGNKEKVLLIANRVSDDKFGVVVDREWDQLDIRNLSDADFCQNRMGVYVTKGHSIENYWFDCDAVISFIISSFSSVIGTDLLDEIKARFPAMIRFAAAYSIAAKESSAITRLGDLLSAADVGISGGVINLLPVYNAKAQGRGVMGDIPSLVGAKLQELNACDVGLLRWICHGHLGEEAIRASVAKLAHSCGVSQNVCREIERGKKVEKLSHDTDYLSRQDDQSLEPLNQVLRWVRE
ncbi:DUF4435 domain-containing protein [Pseudomonas sp. DTU_2021_1001937_2_SI_NGA_ILE_001]|uniref:DUF4435 domain-containing protein n=1 Tax=Pseudomonas sp. DTU_2021_1001937_2_SI_NGA_ILE_001 TaxID=3077589 RepID=UPI0028FC2169|nr:DUF4435 domain-containing protein [Pseudomonas sp. DTU_2021_1001937_2_SI_NGA_ILE_001]WNW14070.1 DUF4435 domain-containing protein [Pseudomonas sp. DTU_2021_1001937_2_SI_NGA_ILE_001]